MSKFKWALIGSWMGLGLAWSEVGDPGAELLNYAIFGKDSLVANGGSSFKTVREGRVGTNGNVNFSGWHAAQIRGPLWVGGNANLGQGAWGSAAADTSNSAAGNLLSMGGSIQGNLGISGYGVFDKLYYKGSLNTSGGASNFGAENFVQDLALNLTMVDFSSAPSASVSTQDCSFGAGKWKCGTSQYDTLPAGDYRDLSAPGGTGLMKFGAGVYRIRSLTIPSGYNAVVYNGSSYTRIFVAQTFQMNGGLGQWFRVDDTTASSESKYDGSVLIRVDGSGSGVNEPAKITAGGTHFSATLMVPNANLTLSANTVFFGQALAKSISFEDGYDGTLGRFVRFGGLQNSLPTVVGDLGSVTKLEDFGNANQVVLSSVFSGASSYSFASKTGIVSAVNNTGTMVLSSVQDKNGLDTVIVTATNAQGSVSDTLYVNLSPVDDAARKVSTGSMNGFPDTSANADSWTTMDLNGYYSDPEGDALSYSVFKILQGKLDANLSAGHLLNIQAKQAMTGMDTLVVAIQSQSLVVYDTLVVQVGASKPYVKNKMGHVIKLEDFADTNQVLLSQVFGGASAYEVKVKGAVLQADTLQGALKLKSKLNQNGLDTVIVTATNAQGSVNDTLFVTVTAVDDGPVAVKNLADTLVQSSGTLNLDLSTYYSDPEGDALTYTVYQVVGDKFSAQITNGKTLQVQAKADSSGFDQIIVAIQSTNKTLYDTLKVQIGSVAPSKVGDFGTALIRKDVNFADTLSLALSYIFKDFSSAQVLSSKQVVQAQIVNGSLQLTSLKDQQGMDTVVVKVSSAAGFAIDTMYVQVLPSFAKIGALGHLQLNMDFAEQRLRLDTVFRGATSYEIVGTVSKVNAKIDQGSLVLNSVSAQQGIETVVVAAVKGSQRLYDTLQLQIQSVNHSPDLSKGFLVIQNPTQGMNLGAVIAFDPDGDAVTLRQLNYTPDFGLRGDSLYIKQLFASEDSVFVIKFELNDGKSKVIRTLTLMVQGQVMGSYTAVLGQYSANQAGMPGFAPSTEIMWVYDLRGHVMASLTGSATLSALGLRPGLYLVRQGQQFGKLSVR